MRIVRWGWIRILTVVVLTAGCGAELSAPEVDDTGQVVVDEHANDDPEIADTGTSKDGVDEGTESDDTAHAGDVAATTGYGRPPENAGVVRVNQQAHLYPPRTVGDGAIVGVLGADMDMEGGCLWLERDGERYGLTWFAEQLDWDHPEAVRSYWARFYGDGSPAELVTSDGTVLAREGDEVQLTGGEVAIEELADNGYELTCQLGDETLVVAHPDAEQSGWPQSPDFEEPGVDKVVQLAHVYPGTTGVGQALVAGTLRADPDLDGGCFWLERTDEEVPIVWAGGYLHPGAYLSGEPVPEGGWGDWDEPEEMRGYWGRFYDDDRPAEVVSTEGEVLAREGDQVEFGGGVAPLDGFEGYDLPCLVSDDLLAVYP